MQHCAKVAGHHKLYCWKRLARRAVMTVCGQVTEVAAQFILAALQSFLSKLSL